MTRPVIRWRPGALLADYACNATRPEPCGLCPHPIHAGQRIARLTDGTGRWAHTACIARLRPRQSDDAVITSTNHRALRHLHERQITAGQ